jgi:hypothetical protein
VSTKDSRTDNIIFVGYMYPRTLIFNKQGMEPDAAYIGNNYRIQREAQINQIYAKDVWYTVCTVQVPYPKMLLAQCSKDFRL